VQLLDVGLARLAGVRLALENCDKFSIACFFQALIMV
jgi:hypothetical protein